MLRVTKVRLYPTKEQEDTLARQFGCARWVWNWALVENQRVYKETGKGLNFAMMTSQLPELKNEYLWLKESYAQVLQASIHNLTAAFQNFFEKRTRYPRFKTKHGKQSIQYPQKVKVLDARVHLPKIGDVKAIIHREIVGAIKTVTVSKKPCGHYYASILTDDGTMPRTPILRGKAIVWM